MFAPAGDSLSFASPKESEQRKGDPQSATPALRYGANLRRCACGARRGTRIAAAQRRSDSHGESDHEAWALRRPCHPATTPPQAQPAGGEQPNSHSGRRCARPKKCGALRVALALMSWAERSNGPSGCSAPTPLCMRRGAQRPADQGSRLSERSAAQRVRARPRWTRAPQVARSEAQGRRQWGRPFFGDFLSAKRKKVTAPPGAHPGSRPWQRHAAKRLTTNQPTINSIASSAYPISARAQFNPQTPTAPCGTWFRSNHRVSRAASVSGWRDSSVASTRSAMSARFMPCSSTRATSS